VSLWCLSNMFLHVSFREAKGNENKIYILKVGTDKSADLLLLKNMYT
jgi:hypothetical protein